MRILINVRHGKIIIDFQLEGVACQRLTNLATNKRIILYCRKRSHNYDLRVFPYSTISSVEVGERQSGHRISFSAAEKICMKDIQNGDVQKFVEYVRSKIEDTAEGNTPSKRTLDIPDQIRKLAELKDQGILTEEEFESKKKELLAKM